jgi:hypothetical protein
MRRDALDNVRYYYDHIRPSYQSTSHCCEHRILLWLCRTSTSCYGYHDDLKHMPGISEYNFIHLHFPTFSQQHLRVSDDALNYLRWNSKFFPLPNFPLLIRNQIFEHSPRSSGMSIIMETLDSDTPENAQKPAAKLRRSCELCRASKGRCIPSKEDVNRCQKFVLSLRRVCCCVLTACRCVKDGKKCVFSEAKPRPKRAKNSRT